MTGPRSPTGGRQNLFPSTHTIGAMENPAIEPAHLMAILSDAITGFDECVQALASSFPSPHWVVVNSRSELRHVEKDDLLLSFLKLVKVASHHNAAIALLREGYVHEIYALCRMIDEACEDIHFMATPLGECGQPSPHQISFCEEFFQEEFSGADPVRSHQSRDRVPRQKVRAAISRIAGNGAGGIRAGRYRSVVSCPECELHLSVSWRGRNSRLSRRRRRTTSLAPAAGLQEQGKSLPGNCRHPLKATERSGALLGQVHGAAGCDPKQQRW